MLTPWAGKQQSRKRMHNVLLRIQRMKRSWKEKGRRRWHMKIGKTLFQKEEE